MQIQVHNHGSVLGFTPLDQEATDFLRYVHTEAWQWMGDTLWIDHRPARAFVAQACEEGVEFVD